MQNRFKAIRTGCNCIQSSGVQNNFLGQYFLEMRNTFLIFKS